MGKPRHSCDPPQNPYIDYVEITTTTAGPTPKENIDLIRYPDIVPCPIVESESCIDLLYNNCEGGIYSYCVINTDSQDVHTMTFTFELTEDSPKLFSDFIDEKIKKFVLTLIWPATQGLAHSFPRNKIPLFSGPFSTLVPKSTFVAFDFYDEEVLSGSVNNWSATGDVEFEVYCEILKDKFFTDRVGSEIVFDISFNPEFVTEIPQELEQGETENTNISTFASSSSVTDNTYDTNHTKNFPDSWFSDFNPGNFLKVFNTNYGGEVYKYYDDCINGALSATITIDSSVDCRILQVESVTQSNRCLQTDGGIMQFSNCKEGRTHNILITSKTKYLCTDTSFQPKLLAGYISTNEHDPCDCTNQIIQPSPDPVIPPVPLPTPDDDSSTFDPQRSVIQMWSFSYVPYGTSGFGWSTDRDGFGLNLLDTYKYLQVSLKIRLNNDIYKDLSPPNQMTNPSFMWRMVEVDPADISIPIGQESTGVITYSKFNPIEASVGSYHEINLGFDSSPYAANYFIPAYHFVFDDGSSAYEKCKNNSPVQRAHRFTMIDMHGDVIGVQIVRWVDRRNACSRFAFDS